jgi:outer membrane immunogenic protein
MDLTLRTQFQLRAGGLLLRLMNSNSAMLGAAMKRLAIALYAVIGLSVGAGQMASAADLPMKAPPMVAAPVPFSWTGFYVGGNVGYGWSEVKPGTVSFYDPVSVFAGSIDGINYSPKGVIGGVQAGYNFQFNNMMLGLEIDYSATGIKGAVYNPTGSTSTSKIDGLATARARAGLVIDRTLIYATGGLAVAHTKTTLDDYYVGYVITTSDAATYVGWTVGAGAEFALSPNWTVKAEYLYADLGSKVYNFYEGSAGWARISGTASLTMSIARVGFNYQFH